MKKFLLFFVFMAFASYGFSQLFISEYSDKKGSGQYKYEFVEIYNSASGSAVDMSGYKIIQVNSTRTFTIPAGTAPIPPGGFLVLGRDGNKTAFENAWGITLPNNVTYINSGNTCPSINGSEKYTLKDASGTTIDGQTAQSIAKNKSVNRIGTGNTSADYEVLSYLAGTPGSLNMNQAVLPIELTNFQAKQHNNQVALNWSTASEINNDYFTVEHSNNGIRFESIGQVTGSGNSNTPQHYAFMDEAPKRGVNYYRLTQTDFDGQSESFDVITVDFQSAGTTIKPTNVKDVMTLSFAPAKEEGQVTIFNLAGQKVYTTAIEAGVTELEVNASSFVNGQYFARIAFGHNLETIRFVKF